MTPSVTYSYARENLKKIFDDVCYDHVPVLVTRKHGEGIVIISTEDYSSMMETCYLMSSPAYCKKLLEARNETDFLSLEDAKEHLGL